MRKIRHLYLFKLGSSHITACGERKDSWEDWTTPLRKLVTCEKCFVGLDALLERGIVHMYGTGRVRMKTPLDLVRPIFEGMGVKI